MTSKELALEVGFSDRYIRDLTKKALDKNEDSITLKGRVFSFSLTSNRHGKAYEYEEKTETIPTTLKKKKSVKTISFDILKELEAFKLQKSYTTVEKTLIIGFYKKYNYSLKAIIKALYVREEKDLDDKEITSFERKVRRWVNDFESKGQKALDDKRGKQASNKKIDEDILEKAVYGAGSRGIRDNFYGAWDLYNGLMCKKTHRAYDEDVKFISYSGFVGAVKRLLESNPQAKSYLRKGYDGLLQDYPVGIKDIGYPNQEWQVDATKFDFMCLIPVPETNGYRVGRVQLTAVRDTFSGVAVATLTENIDSYSQVRVLYKAIEKMGIPELIYTDGGMDYVSKHYQKLILDLGAVPQKAQVGQGRQKGSIERFFGVVQGKWSKIPGYIGNGIAKRKEIEDQTASKIAVRTGKATRINPERLLTFEELGKTVDKLLDKEYNSYEEFAEFRVDEEKLTDIKRRLGKFYTPTVQTDGIQINTIKYQGVHLWEGGLNRGEKVTVYENIDDVNEVFVYRNDEFIGSLKSRDQFLDAMNQEEFKRAKKEYKKNHVTPALKQIAKAKEEYEEFQDGYVERALEHKPKYQEEKPKVQPEDIKKTNEEEYTNDILEYVRA